MTATTATEVLRAHTNVGDYTCGCGWECTEDPRWVDIEAHQADMLAAAGLLVTPEHDAQVAARALAAGPCDFWFPGFYGERCVLPKGGHGEDHVSCIARGVDI